MVWLVADINSSDIGCLYCEKLRRDVRCRVLRMNVNIASAIFRFTSWVMYIPIGCRHRFIKYWQPLQAKSTATYSLPHPENERQRSVDSFGCCIVGNQGILLIVAFRMELLTAVIRRNTMLQRLYTDSKLIDIASCKASKNISLVVANAILRRWYSHTPKARALIESINGPTGRPSDNPPDTGGLGV